MKTTLKRLFRAALVLGAVAPAAHADVRVFACEPEWASLATSLGGNHVTTYSATHAHQDAHFIRARPSLIAKIRRADLVICSGADLEVGWLPVLMQRAPRSVQKGQLGNLIAADFSNILEKPTVIDRSHGDVHPTGNPHVHLHPDNIERIAAELHTRLVKLAPEDATYFTARYQQFQQDWTKARSRWSQQALPLRGKKVVVYHKSFSYLLNWLGIEAIASLEPKPGLPPTSQHLRKVLKRVRGQSVLASIRTPYDNDEASIWLRKRSSIAALVLPFTVGGDVQSTDLISMYDRSIQLLLNTQ